MVNKKQDPPVGRRSFLQSIFGLEGKTGQINGITSIKKLQPNFVWTNLRTGQIGFPTGLASTSALPGFLITPVMAAILCQEELLDPQAVFTCVSSEQTLAEHHTCPIAHGNVNLSLALAYGCKNYFSDASKVLTAPVICRYLEKFGFNRPVAGRGDGKFSPNENEDIIALVLGSSYSVQPTNLQLLRLASLIALEGKILPLHSAEESPNPKDALELTLTLTVWSELKEAMRKAITDNTGNVLDPEDRLTISALSTVVPYGTGSLSWLIGFFPTATPIYAFCACAPVEGDEYSAINLARSYLFSTVWP